jgi:hypothetical protein
VRLALLDAAAALAHAVFADGAGTGACGGGGGGGGGVDTSDLLPPWAAWLRGGWTVTALAADAGVLILSGKAPALAPTVTPGGAPSLAAVARRPAASSADAYRSMIAAGLAGLADAFLSPAEALRLWDVWEAAADTADAVVAAHTTNSSAPAPPQCAAAADDLAASSDAIAVYALGDRAWLRLDAEAA